MSRLFAGIETILPDVIPEQRLRRLSRLFGHCSALIPAGIGICGYNEVRSNRQKFSSNREKFFLKIKNAYIDTDPLDVATPEVSLGFGLHKKGRIRTDVPDPTEVVSFTLEGGEYLQVVVKHPTCSLPYNGAVAFYKVSGNVPETHKELTSSKLLIRPREILTFEDTRLGRTLCIALRWENEKGRLGLPSPTGVGDGVRGWDLRRGRATDIGRPAVLFP
jgi:hypothetical protein